ncbi:MAG: Hsp20/alpha crystallin family protein [Desulfobacterales bacterium]
MKSLREIIPWKRKKEGIHPQSEKSSYGLAKHMDDFFEGAFQGDWITPGSFFKRDGLYPQLGVKEEKGKITVEAEMPGVETKDLDVSLDGRVLKIKGEKRKEEEDKSDGHCRYERSYGYYNRSIELPAQVDPSKVEASYKNGVLKIKLKKVKESETKRIEVRTA